MADEGDYLVKARDAERQAARAATPEACGAWLKIAVSYRELATLSISGRGGIWSRLGMG
jgi:hypothetical protein